jgi:hypothetical protein
MVGRVIARASTQAFPRDTQQDNSSRNRNEKDQPSWEGLLKPSSQTFQQCLVELGACILAIVETIKKMNGESTKVALEQHIDVLVKNVSKIAHMLSLNEYAK